MDGEMLCAPVQLLTRRTTVGVILFTLLGLPARAEKLPTRVYTVADGLPSPVILDMVRDSRGFLWFATRDGLSRFDGSEFRTYTTDHGLTNPVVNTILETRRGEYWVGTNGGGICRLNHDAKASNTTPEAPLFTCLAIGSHFFSNRVNELVEDRDGRLWAGTDRGLFRLERTANTWRMTPIALPELPELATLTISAMYEDSAGRLWVGSGRGLIALAADRVAVYRLPGLGGPDIRDIVEQAGDVWIGLQKGLLRLRPMDDTTGLTTHVLEPRPCRDVAMPRPSSSGLSDRACLITVDDGLPHDIVAALHATPAGRLWIGTWGGLAYLDSTGVTSLTPRAQLAAGRLSALTLDDEGQLWVGTQAGVARLIVDGFVSYGPEQGLGDARVRTLLEHRSGSVFAVSDDWQVSGFQGGRFLATKAWTPPDATFTFYSQGALLDSTDRWWVLTNRGLHRLRPHANLDEALRQPPEAVYTTRHGLPTDRIDRVFEDSRGDIWIGTRSATHAVNLSRWQRATNEIRVFRDGFGPDHQFPLAFAEDRQGAVWIGFESGGLARHHREGFVTFGRADGIPADVTALYVDDGGSLWIASSSAGVRVLRDVESRSLRLERYTTAEGLSSNNVQVVVQDALGRVYFGTSRGLDRLDPATGKIKHFSTSDGLAGDYVTAALRDRSGRLWFGTHEGVSRLVPARDEPAPPSPVWISEVRAGGVLQPLAELGATQVSNLELPAGQNHLQVAFFGIAFGAAGPLRYRYRLEGAESNWTGPINERVVHYASLSPGRYRFVVEALNADGVASRQPASVAFVVLPPLWQRGWFMTSAIVVAIGVAYALHRVRVARILAVERVRARIAADLHDDIGGSLSRIAIQSEVARRDLAEDSGPSAQRLVEIGDTARAVVESLADVVWSVDPVQDDLASVERRVREYAADVLGPRGVRWTFHGTGHLDRFALGPEARRDLLLLLKEGITNIARHAQARVASLHLRVAGGELHAELQDDGRGFDAVALAGEGDSQRHGIANMRMRARQLQGDVTIDSTPGVGTRITLRIPLRARKRMNMRLRRVGS